jgi:hypothetical protein
LYGTGTNLINH